MSTFNNIFLMYHDYKKGMNMRKSIIFMFFLLVSIFTISGCNSAPAEEDSKLSQIINDGVIKVGTTGDYKPFTYLNPDTGEFEGSDIDAAKMLAENLGVEVEF